MIETDSTASDLEARVVVKSPDPDPDVDFLRLV
jgi:hypothetical protein